MTVGIVAATPEVIDKCVVKMKKKPIKDDLRSPHNLFVEVHTTPISKISTFPEARNQHFEKLRQHVEHGKEKWNEAINVGNEFKNHRHILIDKLSKIQEMWDGHIGTIRVTTHRTELTEEAKPSFQPPYKARLTQSEQKKK